MLVSLGGVPDPLTPPPFDVVRGLAAVGAEVRAEWRADEEMWMREAARRWAHGRRIGDLLREYASRGDRISVDVAGCTFVGLVRAVGDDRVDVATAGTVVTVHTALTTSFGAIATPLVIRRLHRARAGGCRLPSVLVTFRARLREIEEASQRVRVGTFLSSQVMTGRLVVGADHVALRGDDDVVLPTAWVAYVAEVSGAGS